MKKLSIITVCYNSEKFIERCIKSIVNQLTDECEYVIIDGASKDNTLKIINKYKDSITLYSEKDNGIYDAMNKGLKKATGKYVIFMNSDDWFEEGAIEAILNAIKTNKDCYYGNMISHIYSKKEEYIKEVKAPGVDQLNRVLNNPIWCHQSFWCKKDAMEKVGGFSTDYRIASDWEAMIKLIKKGYKFEHVDNVIANYSQGGQSSRWHLKEKKSIRKKHKTYKIFDLYSCVDLIQEVKDVVLNFIFGRDIHYKMLAWRLKYTKK